MPNLKVGQKYNASCAGTDGSTIPNGALNAISSDPTIVSTQQSGDGSPVIQVRGVAVGAATVTYIATGYQNATETVNVAAAPSIVVTDGPITN